MKAKQRLTVALTLTELRILKAFGLYHPVMRGGRHADRPRRDWSVLWLFWARVCWVITVACLTMGVLSLLDIWNWKN